MMALMYCAEWLKAALNRDGEEGQGGLEYALVAGVIVFAIITALAAFPVDGIVDSALGQLETLIGA